MGIDSSLDEKWMKIALEQARFAQAKNEVPVGAILVKDDQLIASAHNHLFLTMIRLLMQKFNYYAWRERG